MSFDSFNNFRGTFLGTDRKGHTTPSPDACDNYRPFMPVPYPAAWLPIKRRDEGHPIAAGVVLSEGQLVGVDKSGALIPAGLFCGKQANGAPLVPTLVSLTTNVATLTVANKCAVGEKVAVAGFTAGDAFFNGTYTVKAGSDATKILFDLVHVDVVGKAPNAGVTVTSTLAGQYCVLVYTQYDVGTTTNPQTGVKVAAAGEFVVLAAPADSFVGDKITLPNTTSVTIKQTDIDFAFACNLIPGGMSHPLGYAVRNVFVYIGGIQITDATGGIKYLLLTQRPDQMQVTNYMHEMGTTIQTRFVLRLPWVGKDLGTLTALAAADGVAGYVQTDYSRSFVHFTGDKGDVLGKFFLGCSVVPSRVNNGFDAGNFAPYDPAVNTVDDICGRVLGVELMYPIRDYANRVRTQFERANEFVGPRMDPNPVTFQMGGSATKGMDYAISITTNGLFQQALSQNKAVHDEYATYVLVHVNCR